MSHEGSVLIVDAEPMSVELIARRLAEAGFATSSASGTEEAVSLALSASRSFDVVLVGHRLTDGTGVELVRRLRADARTAGISIALLTAMPDPEETTLILEAGADEVLRKPIHRVELVARVRSLHRIKRQLDELRLANARLGELNVALEQSATTDGLTGLLNRRQLDRRLVEEVQRAHRYGTPLSVLMVDIDHFKKVNDGYGHAAGDAVLRAIAGEIRASVRIMDITARYGGEEIVVLGPSTSWPGGRALGERLRAAIERLEVSVPGLEAPIRVTASIGVSTLASDEDAGKLLARADEALYEAKHSGRNRVVMSGTEPEAPTATLHRVSDLRDAKP